MEGFLSLKKLRCSHFLLLALLFKKVGFRKFGNKHKMGICGKSCLQCDPARVPPHAFDNDAAGMSLCGRLQAINGLHCNVGGGFKAESVIGTAQIIVYGFRNADNVHAEFAQRIRNAESVVPADGAQQLQILLSV